MTDKPSIEQIQDDLSHLKNHDVVVYGSYCTNHFTQRSDIDIAVVTRENDREQNKNVWRDLLGTAPERYDINVYELLPLHIQIDIVTNHIVVFGNKVDLSYYFYQTRKAWNDVEKRYRENQFHSVQERLKAMNL